MLFCWNLGKPAGVLSKSGPRGLCCCCVFKYRKCEGWSAAPGQEVERLELGPCAEKLTLTGPHFLFLTCGTSSVFSVLKQDPAGLGPFPWRLFLPGLVLSSALCCLDLRLQSWYKYHTFSWTRYSRNTAQTAESRASRLEMRTLKTEIKRGGALSKH